MSLDSSQDQCRVYDSGVAAAPQSSLIHLHPDSTSISAGYQPRPRANIKWQRKTKTKTYSHSTHMLRFAINFTLSVSRGTAGILILPSLHLRPLQDALSSHAMDILSSFVSYIMYDSELPDNFQELVSATIIQLQEVFDRGEATRSDIFAYHPNLRSFQCWT